MSSSTLSPAPISLLHATRGRYKQAIECRDKWLAMATHPESVEHIFGIDDDDMDSLVNIHSDRVIIPAGSGCVAAWNACAVVAHGELFIQLSDDWEPVQGWDVLIRKEFEGVTGEQVLAISDGARTDDLLCMAILNKARYTRYGYLFHPKFYSVYSDNYFTWQAKQDGVIKDAKYIVFEHKHPVWGKAEWDVTYTNSNSPEKYTRGLMLFQELTRKPGATVVLAMIVKNEKDNIEACLESVKDHINYWVICDTGSTDGTQALIKKVMAKYKIPGKLYQRPWVDFAANRSESLALARSRGDYTLVIDADDRLDVNNNAHVFKDLKYDQYHMKIIHGELSYHRVQLFRNEHEWKYKGVLHEFLDGPKDVLQPITTNLIIRASASQARGGYAGPKKYLGDALILEKALLDEEEPSMRSRYYFYLAQSYRDAGEHKKAMEAYATRATMGGWEEEVYYCKYMHGRLKINLQYSDDDILCSLLAAWEYRPSRIDALYDAVMFLSAKGRLALAYALAGVGVRTAVTTDILFVRTDIQQWRMLDEYAILSYKTGNPAEAVRAATALVNGPAFPLLPAAERERITKNFDVFKKHASSCTC